MAKPPRTTKISDRSVIPDKKGNGQIRFEVVRDETGKVLTYSMAYVNHKVYAGDNGRVVGYDNAHGYDHRHYMGTIEAVEFISLEETVSRFEAEWQQYLEKRKAK